MGSIFFGITVIICLAALLSLFFRIFSQPAILAYILTGIVIAHIGLFTAQSQQVLQELAEVGITLLLFMLGLEIKLSELPTIGKVVFFVGTAQIIFSTAIGYGLGLLLGYSQITSLYIGLALTFSSTIIVVKLLSDKKDLHSLYGKIAIGILLLQDFLAIGVLIFLSSFTQGSQLHGTWFDLYLLFYKGLVLIFAVMLVSKFILPKLLDFVARSSETLFLFSLAWVFGMAAFVSSRYMGFSIEIGGFLAGLALSSTTENYQIAAKMKTLRDFFVILFFVLLGMQMRFTSIATILFPTIIFSLFILLGKPLIVMISMGALGYRRRTSLLTGISLAQVSEFSLILLFVGARLGQIPNEIISVITFVSIISFTLSTYMIMYGNKLYRGTHSYLKIFERKQKIEEIGEVGEHINHVVLVGAHRMGESILHALAEQKEDIIVVDFDPAIVAKLREKRILSLFGDITDFDIQEKAQLHSAKLVVSTVPDLEDNIILIKYLNKLNKRAKIVVIGQDKDEAKILYKAGADYVVLPHITGGRHVAKLLKGDNLQNIAKIKSEDFVTFI